MVLPAAALALEAMAEIAAGTSAVVVSTEAAALLATAEVGVGGVIAGSIGTVGALALAPEAVIAIGGGFAILAVTNAISSLAADMTVDCVEAFAKNLDPNDIKNVRKVEKSVAFGTFAARAGKFTAQDTFSQKYPYDPSGAFVVNMFDNQSEKSDGKRTNKARIVGYWAVHVNIVDYDQSKVSSWKHSLTRANFGSLAFCFKDEAVHEAPIHYTRQIIPVPIVRMLTADSSMGDISQAVCNKIHGYLSPSVVAEISFIPVYECTGWFWQKAKPP
jgi:hypothetical protein